MDTHRTDALMHSLPAAVWVVVDDFVNGQVRSKKTNY